MSLEEKIDRMEEDGSMAGSQDMENTDAAEDRDAYIPANVQDVGMRGACKASRRVYLDNFTGYLPIGPARSGGLRFHGEQRYTLKTSRDWCSEIGIRKLSRTEACCQTRSAQSPRSPLTSTTSSQLCLNRFSSNIQTAFCKCPPVSNS